MSPSSEKMKNLPSKAPTCNEPNPQAPKRPHSSCQGDSDQTPLETSTAKNQSAADPTPGPTCPSTVPPKSKRFKMKARKGANPILNKNLASSSSSTEDEMPPSSEKMKGLASKAPTCKEPNPQAPKRAHSSCQGNPDQTPLETSTAKNQPAANPTPGPTCPSTDPPKFTCFKMTITPQVNAKSANGPVGKPVKPSSSPEATVEADRGEDLDSYFASLLKRTTLAASKASDGATSSAIDPPPTAEEIEQAKRTFMSFLHMSFSEIVGSSETFSKTLNTLVRSSGISHYVQLALQLLKHAFPSLSKTYDSTNRSKAVVDNQLQQADDLCAKLNQDLECYQKLKTEEEDAQSEKKAIKDNILLLQERLTQLDDKLTDLSSQKEVLYETTKANHTAYKKLEGELPLLSFMKSKLEVELAEIEKTWVNFRSTFGSRVQNN